MTKHEEQRATPGMRQVLPYAVALGMSMPGGYAHAQTQSASPFTLGEVRITAQQLETPELGALADERVGASLSAQEMQAFNRSTVGEALNLLPGVTLSTNSRNEQVVYVRGFDARQVPVFIDGIPVYVPYDGYLDFNRFATMDLARIEVDKGMSALAYGPNTLGGAINLVSRRPARPFEGDAGLQFGSGPSRQAFANMGGRKGAWYWQGGAFYGSRDAFPLSANFKPTATEDGGARTGSDQKDWKVSFKAGWIGSPQDEAALSLISQHGEKGQPPSVIPAAARYWNWPYWDKDSLYFSSKWSLGRDEALRVNVFLDRFGNEVDAYTDASLSVLKSKGPGSLATGKSIYDDRSYGAMLMLESGRWAGHALHSTLNLKEDRHEESDANRVLGARYVDRLWAWSLEDSWTLQPEWRLEWGAGRTALLPHALFNAQNAYSLPGAQNADNVQAGLFHTIDRTSSAYLSLAHKTRLPTLKDRYSQRLGSYIENPNLQAEKALHLEGGYRMHNEQLDLEFAAFMSDVENRIQTVANVSGTKAQMQNVGQARMQGLEISLQRRALGAFDLGGNYTYIDARNTLDPNVRITDLPRHKLTAFLNWQVRADLRGTLLAEYDSARWISSTQSLSGFATLNGKIGYQLAPGQDIECGVNNLADRNYFLADGFPSPGRTAFVRLHANF